MKHSRLPCVMIAVVALSFSSGVKANAYHGGYHNEYWIYPGTFDEVGGAIRIWVGSGCDHPVETSYRTEDGTAQAGKDYTSASGRFAVSQSSPGFFDLPILHDTLDEGNETIGLIITDVSGGNAGGGVIAGERDVCTGTDTLDVKLTIRDNDFATTGGAKASPAPGQSPAPNKSPAPASSTSSASTAPNQAFSTLAAESSSPGATGAQRTEEDLSSTTDVEQIGENLPGALEAGASESLRPLVKTRGESGGGNKAATIVFIAVLAAAGAGVGLWKLRRSKLS